MTRTDRIAKIIESIKASAAGYLSGHEVVSTAFADYAPAIAMDRAIATLRVAEARGLIRYTQVQVGPTFHHVYKV